MMRELKIDSEHIVYEQMKGLVSLCHEEVDLPSCVNLNFVGRKLQIIIRQYVKTFQEPVLNERNIKNYSTIVAQ
jgi:hypothetical protein